MRSSEASAGSEPVRGFTLLIAVVMTSVILSVGMALFDISYKQAVLSSAARQSQNAFYAADSAMECALYWDQKLNAFSFTNPLTSSSILCGTLAVTGYTTAQSGGVRTTSFTIPCAGGGVNAGVQVYKSETSTTSIFSSGYNTCTVSDPRRTERGLKVVYGGGTSGSGGGSRSFSISPSVAGKSTWSLDVDGPLTLSTSGTWTITPSSNFSAVAEVWGGGGGSAGSFGGGGGYAEATVTITSGQSLTLMVGGGGSGTIGGSNGGGSVGGPVGGGGGGKSDIRRSGSYVLVAGGGGGAGVNGAGGAGGGTNGVNGKNTGGRRGTQTSGGAGSVDSYGYNRDGLPGTSGTGGNAVAGNGNNGGGGGGGYFGGGGGRGDSNGVTQSSGGGGGSGYADPGSTTGAVLTAGNNTTPGRAGAGVGGTVGAGQTGQIILR